MNQNQQILYGCAICGGNLYKAGDTIIVKYESGIIVKSYHKVCKENEKLSKVDHMRYEKCFQSFLIEYFPKNNESIIYFYE